MVVVIFNACPGDALSSREPASPPDARKTEQDPIRTRRPDVVWNRHRARPLMSNGGRGAAIRPLPRTPPIHPAAPFRAPGCRANPGGSEAAESDQDTLI